MATWEARRVCDVVHDIHDGRIVLPVIQRSLVWNEGKMELLYNYLVSPQFRSRIEDIVEAFTDMRSELEKEKRSMLRAWARREKLIDRVQHGTATMYGQLEGIVGSEIAALPALEMPYALGLDGDTADEDDAA